MKLAEIIPVPIDLGAGKTETVNLPRATYRWCHRVIREEGYPPFWEGGFSAIIAKAFGVLPRGFYAAACAEEGGAE